MSRRAFRIILALAAVVTALGLGLPSRAQAPGDAPLATVYTTPPEGAQGAELIEAVARQWFWTFEYENGFRSRDLVLPAGQSVHLRVRTEDTSHVLEARALGLALRAPNEGALEIWLRVDVAGTYRADCGIDCDGHWPLMWADVVVMAPETYVRHVGTFGGELSLPPAERGERVYDRLGCSGCHGARNAFFGASPNGLWGSTLLLDDGTFVSVEGESGRDFVRESILQPDARVTAGYLSGLMPSFRDLVSDEEIEAIVDYLHCLGRGPCGSPDCAGLSHCQTLGEGGAP